MLIPVIFSFFAFETLSLLMYIIAKHAPKGEFLSIDYNSMPGIMTPNTLRTRESWVAAHEATSTLNLFISIYFTFSAAVMIYLILSGYSGNREHVFVYLLFIGLGLFGVSIIYGDRVAAQLDKKDVR